MNQNMVATNDDSEWSDALAQRISERLEKMEAKLLREFRKWAVSSDSRFRANEILVGGFNERLIALEERVSDIEGKSES